MTSIAQRTPKYAILHRMVFGYLHPNGVHPVQRLNFRVNNVIATYSSNHGWKFVNVHRTRKSATLEGSPTGDRSMESPSLAQCSKLKVGIFSLGLVTL